jgi:hypothetical protein
VQYAQPPHHYRELWVVRVDDRGRCVSFEEWTFAPKPAK